MTNNIPRDMNIGVPSDATENNEPHAVHQPSYSQSKKINPLNWLNLVAFVLNVVVTYGVGVAGWIGNGTNGQLSEKYQTLVTPNGTAFSIWGIIFISQGIFSLVQLLPSFRQLPLVQNGIGYNYITACFFQIGWTIAFSFEYIILSAVFMIAIWLSLLRLLVAQYYSMANGTWLEFFLLRLPFATHCGWVTAASALNVNVVLVSQGASAANQLGAGIVSLAILHAISVWVTFALAKPNFTLAFVLAWANYWIHVELDAPLDSISERFSADALQGVSGAAQGVAIVILLQVLLRFLWNTLKTIVPSDVFKIHMSSLIFWPATAGVETMERASNEQVSAPPTSSFWH